MMMAPAPDPSSYGWRAQQASSDAQGTVVEAIALPMNSGPAGLLLSATVPLVFRSGQGPTALMRAPAPHDAMPQSDVSRLAALSSPMGTGINAAALRRPAQSKFGTFCIEQLDAAEGRTQALRRRTRDVCDGAEAARVPGAGERIANVAFVVGATL